MTEVSTTVNMTLPASRLNPVRTYKIPLLSRAAAPVAGFGAAMLLIFLSPAYAATAGVAQGQEIASKGTTEGVPACASCHGVSGEGSVAFPRLGGTGYLYLQAQLNAFANGSRKNPIMQPFAEKLTQAQRDALALYYSQLPPLSTTAMPSDSPGAALATKGRWSDQIPACAQCHGPGGRGVGANFPPLAGLPAAYITEQLQAWKSAERPPGPLALMPTILRHLSDQDIADVSAYYAGMTLTPVVNASNKSGKKGQP